jgi:GAF domain
VTLAGAATSVVCATFVKEPSGAINSWWLAGQIAGMSTAALAPTISAWRAKRGETAASQREINARTQTRVEMNEAIDPIVRSLASSVETDVVGLRKQVLSLVTKTAKEIIGPEQGVRACYFDLEAGPPKRLVATDYRAGRIGGTRSGSIEGTEDGDAAIAMVESSGHLLCVDIEKDPPPGWDNRPRDYRTFISVAVVAKDIAYGMLTVDAPQPDDLHPRDVDVLTVMAGLLAIAMKFDPPSAGVGHDG